MSVWPDRLRRRMGDLRCYYGANIHCTVCLPVTDRGVFMYKCVSDPNFAIVQPGDINFMKELLSLHQISSLFILHSWKNFLFIFCSILKRNKGENKYNNGNNFWCMQNDRKIVPIKVVLSVSLGCTMGIWRLESLSYISTPQCVIHDFLAVFITENVH